MTNKLCVFFTFALALMLLLSACAPRGNAAAQSAAATAPTVATETADMELAPAAEPEPVPTADSETAPAPENAAFRAALTNLLTEGVMPDGSFLSIDANIDYSDSTFAVFDADGDGKNELLLLIGSACIAGETACLYGFDAAENQFTEELGEYPLLTFYSNNVIQAGWSHNQGRSGSFWPYTLYGYDAGSDSYTAIGLVDAWEKDFDAEGYPDEVDVSHTGIVYYVMQNGVYEDVDPVDAAAYEAWCETKLGGAAIVEPPLLPLTAKNAAAIR